MKLGLEMHLKRKTAVCQKEQTGKSKLFDLIGCLPVPEDQEIFTDWERIKKNLDNFLGKILTYFIQFFFLPVYNFS